jgi:hypothetical protein
MAEGIFIESLTQAHALRDAVLSKYGWFVHDTGLARLGAVRTNGLVLRHYEPHEIPQDVREYLGEGGCGILCFYPDGADLRPQSSQEPPHIRLAIPALSLPATIGMDWSYENKRVQRRREQNPDAPLIDLCLQVIQELGSIASYIPVNAEELRVCSIDSDPGAPKDWPYLKDTADDRIMHL